MPFGAMPKAAQEHRQRKIENSSRWPNPTAAQRNVDVIADPAGQRHMPSLPEIRDVLRDVGEPKVRRELQTEHASEPDGDVTVAAEVKKNPHRKERHQQKHFRA